MAQINIKCKHCGDLFNVEAPAKVGIYRTTYPHCNETMNFKVFPQYKAAGRSLEPMKAMSMKCPYCTAAVSAPLPSSPGFYGILCPSCRHEIKIRMM